MAIPNTQDLMFPILDVLKDGKIYRIREIVDNLADSFNLTDEERKQLTPGGSKALFHSRVMNARSYLYRAELIEHPTRGRSNITKRGLEVVENPPEKLDLNFLTRYPEFMEYIQNSSTAQRDPELRKLLRRVKDRLEAKDKPEEPSVVWVKEEPKTIKMQPVNTVPSTPNPPAESLSTPVVVGNQPVISDDQLMKAVAAINFLNTKNQREDRRERLEEQRQTAGFTQLQMAWMMAVRFVENYFQHPLLYLLPLVLMIAAGVVATTLAKSEYESNGILFVQEDTLISAVSNVQDDGFGWVTPAQSTSDELNELLQTDSFIRIIIQQTNLEELMDQGETVVNDTFEEARRAFSVYPLGQNQLQISVTYEDREIAYQLANAAVNSYIDWQISADKQDTSAARAFLENLVPQYRAEYDASVSSLETYLLQNPAPVRGDRPAIETLQIERLRSDVAIADSRYQGALENLEQIRLEEVVIEGKTRQTYSIIDAPARPRNPELQDIIIDTGINIGIFVAVGIALTLVGIAGSTLLDRGMNYPIDARYVTSLPVLTTIPTPKPRRRTIREVLFGRRKKASQSGSSRKPDVQPAAAASSPTTANQ
ncbi:MAG: winged helix-turn-helix domain-containing protein [Ardenticatenaceae bacterium]|nr:winged helix-turn-helix domain-containing protein [Ardenticatenaceae bacterium]